MNPLIAVILAAVAARAVAEPPVLRSILPDALTGGATAVVLPEETALVHTAQVLPRNRGGAAEQTEAVLMDLESVLQSAGAGLSRVAKLNVYLAAGGDFVPVRDALAARFRGETKPAISYVVGELSSPGAVIAMDAVAVSSFDASAIKRYAGEQRAESVPAASVLPPGPKLYVSGMADTNSLLPATRKTLEKLVACIGQLGSQREDIAQLKVFLQPMSEVAAVRKEIANFFDGQAPPTVFVDWISANPVVEIELIAAAHGDLSGETNSVSYFTPPGTTDSKVYRRVARVNHGKTIYVSGLFGLKSSDGAGQIREIFSQLGEVTKQAGSDFEHLVKATYYVTDSEASDQLNKLRPEYYNPLRPPAASKAKVKGVGIEGRTVTLDMIAVTK